MTGLTPGAISRGSSALRIPSSPRGTKGFRAVNIYTTTQGDTWDAIAYKQLGSTDYTDQLVSANLEYAGTLLFPAGVTLRLPEISEKTSGSLPPWKR